MRFQHIVSILLAYLSAVLLAACSHPPQETAAWNPKAAATYLDAREVTWRQWPIAARDHDTFCVSCHTVVPYVISRPMLRPALAEQNLSDPEQKIFDNVERRVRLWDTVEPYYSQNSLGYGQVIQSRGTEAVLNAFILATRDAHDGHLRDTTRMALKQMWDLQQPEGADKGAWPWIDHGMEPWEAGDSQFFGAALAAVVVGVSPADYRFSPDIQIKLASLQGYLNREYQKQSSMNKVAILWASTKLPGLLDPSHQKSIIHDILNKQQTDGGWQLSSNVWPGGLGLHSAVRTYLRSDWTRQDLNSDGYATGFITFVLEEAGISRRNEHLKRALSWLATNQNSADGSWSSVSVAQRRNPSSNIGHFMKDAATAYAVLALTDRETTLTEVPNDQGPAQGSPEHPTSSTAKPAKTF